MRGPWLIPDSAEELVTLVLEHGEAAPERAIFGFMADGESEPEPLTYGALAAGAQAVAAWLQGQRVGREPVLVACPTSAEFVIALLGCFFAGSIAVPVPPLSMRRMLPRLAAIAAMQVPVLRSLRRLHWLPRPHT